LLRLLASGEKESTGNYRGGNAGRAPQWPVGGADAGCRLLASLHSRHALNGVSRLGQRSADNPGHRRASSFPVAVHVYRIAHTVQH
jgi:hypothetical protein